MPSVCNVTDNDSLQATTPNAEGQIRIKSPRRLQDSLGRHAKATATLQSEERDDAQVARTPRRLYSCRCVLNILLGARRLHPSKATEVGL